MAAFYRTLFTPREHYTKSIVWCVTKIDNWKVSHSPKRQKWIIQKGCHILLLIFGPLYPVSPCFGIVWSWKLTVPPAFTRPSCPRNETLNLTREEGLIYQTIQPSNSFSRALQDWKGVDFGGWLWGVLRGYHPYLLDYRW